MEIDPFNLHHAYLILGDKNTSLSWVYNLLEKLGIEKTQNPDVYFFENNSFLIEDARNLSEKAWSKAFGSKKFFIITSSKFSVEAQNALLKTFEEPPINTHFFILINDRDLLIPTLLSRVEIRILDSKIEDGNQAKKFLEMNIKERMEFIKKSTEDKNPLSPFLDLLLIELRKDEAKKTELEKVFKFRKYSDDPSVMSRLILEHLALVLK